MTILKILPLLSLLFLSACANEYAPKENTLAKTIYKDACERCHQSIEGSPGMYWELDPKNANRKFIALKVQGGSIMMPKFPNIYGSNMTRLGKYVLEHSLVK